MLRNIMLAMLLTASLVVGTIPDNHDPTKSFRRALARVSASRRRRLVTEDGKRAITFWITINKAYDNENRPSPKELRDSYRETHGITSGVLSIPEAEDALQWQYEEDFTCQSCHKDMTTRYHCTEYCSKDCYLIA